MKNCQTIETIKSNALRRIIFKRRLSERVLCEDRLLEMIKKHNESSLNKYEQYPTILARWSDK